MTDNEIIKALNYCCGNIKNNDEECNEDMCYQVCLPESREEGIRWCGEWLMKDALDLINRQKAEIEQWKEEADRWQNAFCKVNEDMSTIKFEAIKEFAHLVIDRSRNGVICVSDVPDLVKEMTEEKDES